MPEQFRDGGQGELLASYMSGTFSEDAARKLCFEQDNQIRVLKQEVEYRKKRDEKLTAIAADLTGKLADAEINLAATVSSIADALECDAHPTPEHEALAQIVSDIHTGLHRSEAALAAVRAEARRERDAEVETLKLRLAAMQQAAGMVDFEVRSEREACVRIVEGMAREQRAMQSQLGIKDPGSPIVVAAATLEDAARRLRERVK